LQALKAGGQMFMLGGQNFKPIPNPACTTPSPACPPFPSVTVCFRGMGRTREAQRWGTVVTRLLDAPRNALSPDQVKRKSGLRTQTADLKLHAHLTFVRVVGNTSCLRDGVR